MFKYDRILIYSGLVLPYH